MLENQPAPPGTEDVEPTESKDDVKPTDSKEDVKPTESKEDKVPRKSALEVSLKGYNGKPFIGMCHMLKPNI